MASCNEEVHMLHIKMAHIQTHHHVFTAFVDRMQRDKTQVSVDVLRRELDALKTNYVEYVRHCELVFANTVAKTE